MRSLFLIAALTLTVAQAGAQQQVDQTVQSSPTGQVEVVNTAGHVRLVGWDRSEIRITGTLGEGTERLAVEGSGDRTVIRVVIPNNRRNVRGSDLEIRVPTRKDVTVRTTSADIEIQGIAGGVAGRSTSGRVNVTGSPRQVTASSTSGEVIVNARTSTVRASSTSGNVRIAGAAQESVAAEAVSGDVEVTASTPELAAESVSGNLTLSGATRRASASTVSGDATIRGSRLQYLSFESVSGNLRFDGDLLPAAAIKAESHSGNIDLLLPANVSADFQASSFSGDIVNDFGPAAQSTNRYTPSSELRFSTGNGGVVEARTFSGDIRLRRR